MLLHLPYPSAPLSQYRLAMEEVLFEEVRGPMDQIDRVLTPCLNAVGMEAPGIERSPGLERQYRLVMCMAGIHGGGGDLVVLLGSPVAAACGHRAGTSSPARRGP